MELTQPYRDVDRKVSGYMLNAVLSPDNQEIIEALKKQFQERFSDVVLIFPKEALHITLMDWVAPLVDYEKDKDELFWEVFEKYDEALSRILSEVNPIEINFDTIGVSSGAIFISGKDNGEMQDIRDTFLDKAELIQGTKQPPKIIHATIARFKSRVDLKLIQEFASTLDIKFTQRITEFRLVNEKVIPMLEYDVVKTYPL